eukprot:TRINITY_DN1600_c0_g1_i2.p1 TRINITY_DN1600_c0_g1~~TRINITY_DN1600_c0_g1_i2.p1  ORF type:complete len:254 (-),score=40.92 TRINITY_DN1600_c0_g1_i2:77-838(-)
MMASKFIRPFSLSKPFSFSPFTSKALLPSILTQKRAFSTGNDKNNFTLYFAPTSNGFKIPIALEELNLSYKLRQINLSKNEQKEDWYLKINPNGKIPVVVDHFRNDFAVFESGAILLYLVEHYDKEGKLFPKDSNARSEVIQWLMFQMAGIGPMSGQAWHFLKAAPEKIDYAINRYLDETKRLYSVLEKRLGTTGNYLAGNQYTIADIATFPWIRTAKPLGIPLETNFPHLSSWFNKINERPAVVKALEIAPK